MNIQTVIKIALQIAKQIMRDANSSILFSGLFSTINQDMVIREYKQAAVRFVVGAAIKFIVK